MAHYVAIQAFDAVKTRLANLGDTLKHDFGSEALQGTREPNSYVWIPTQADAVGRGAAVGGGDKHRTVWEVMERFDVVCDGESHEVAVLMRDNLWHALKAEVAPAALKDFGATWDYPKEGEPQLGLGRALVVHVGISSVIPDRYVPILPYVRNTPQSPTAPNVPTTLIGTVIVSTSSGKESRQQDEAVAVDTITN